MDQERIDFLFSRLLSGEATLAEQIELEIVFRENSLLRETWIILRKLKELPPQGLSTEEEQSMMEHGLRRLDAIRREHPGDVPGRPPLSVGYSSSAVERSLLKVAAREEKAPGEDKPARKTAGIRWMIAAACILGLVVAVTLFRRDQKAVISSAGPGILREVVSKKGSRSYIELSDGSKLWMNAGSSVRYRMPFAEGKRELTLSGEAYFDVKHDPSNPFIIHTGRLNVRVLGTTLNVKAYPGDSLTETTLIKGKVEVDFENNSHASVLLRPSEKLLVRMEPNQQNTSVSANSTISSPPVTTEKGLAAPKVMTAPVLPDSADGTIEETLWVENKLAFRKEPFAQLAQKLERWYNVKIRFDNDKYKMEELTGTFKEQRIDEVMRALQLTSAFHYRIAGDTIHIW